MKLKLFAILLTLAMVLSMLAGCGSSQTDSADTSDSAETEESEEAASEEADSDADEAEASEAAETEEASESAAASSISYPVSDGDVYTISVVADGNLLTYIEDQDPANCYGIKLMEEATGIELDYTVFAMLSDNMLLMISSGEWTDIICKIDENYTAGIQGALDEEVVLDIAPYIEEYAPDYAAYVASDELFQKECYTDDGQMGGFYSFSVPNVSGWAIRQDWLDEAGVTEIPETYDELEEACLAVLNAHPELDACINMASSFIAEGYESELMYGYGLDTMNNEFYRQEDGTIGYAWTSDNARAYIEMVARWVDEGIVNRDQIISGDASTMGSNLYIGEALMKHNGVDMFADDQLALADDENFSISPMNEPTVNEGDTLRFGGAEMSTSLAWSISTTCPNVETLIQAINWIYTDEGTIAMNFGEEDKSYTVDEDGNYAFTDYVLNNPDGVALFMATSLATGLEVPKIGLQEAADAKLTNQLQLDAQDYYYSQDRTTDGVRRGSLNTEETEAISGYTDIDTYVQENVMAFVVGEKELNDESWAEFCETIESMGIEDIIAAYQSAEDRYDAK